MHLTPLGVERAKATGEWLRQEFADGFELALSWNGGAWEHFQLRKFSDDKLLGLAQNYPRLFSQVEQC
ncbi:hypothetical protein H7171_03090 [Candidatus Saccharibacteria bacterium]|nr:hypothetical protein [Candidatus Saccharibacteria bacterium]